MYFAFQISVRLGDGGPGQTPREWLQNARKPAFQPLRELPYLKTSQRPVKPATRPFCGASTAHCVSGSESMVVTATAFWPWAARTWLMRRET